MVWEDPKKNIAKKYQKHEIPPHSVAVSEALTTHHTYFFRHLFNRQFFLKLLFLFWSQDKSRSRNMNN